MIGCYIPIHALLTFAAYNWLQLGLQMNDDLKVYSYNVVGFAEVCFAGTRHRYSSCLSGTT